MQDTLVLGVHLLPCTDSTWQRSMHTFWGVNTYFVGLF